MTTSRQMSGSHEPVSTFRVAIVGSGPRGLGVLERTAARLLDSPPHRPIEIYLIDTVEVGCGRVWRSDQPEWFVMNTVCGEVTMFSGPPDNGPTRPGSGPSLAEWWESNEEGFPGPDGYAPRALHGRYMRHLLDAIEATLPRGVVLHRVSATVEDLEPTADGYRLDLSDGGALLADKIVLTTGHARLQQTGRFQEFEKFASARPRLRYLPGDSAADMQLNTVPAGSGVGILGLGLSFYDVMLALTVGRGGRFVNQESEQLEYQASGREPVLFAGSRSGIPVPARGLNQKPAILAFDPLLFTTDNVLRNLQDGAIDFTTDVLPWILAEIDLVYYRTLLRVRGLLTDLSRLETAVSRAAANGTPAVRLIAQDLGISDIPPDLRQLSRPFDGAEFASTEEFDRALTEHITRDLRHADRGNYDDPLKASLDVLRDTRWVIRRIVDFGGLTPESHRGGFLSWFSPRSSLLAAGPPRVRLRQTAALRRAGILHLVGPDIEVGLDDRRGVFELSSPAVRGSRVDVDTLIDARTPSPDVGQDLSALTRNLLRRGIWTEFVNSGDGVTFRTGGVAVTRSPFHPIRRDGSPDHNLHVLGIPTEHTRWFTLVGSGRPGSWNEFTSDADAIAAEVLLPVSSLNAAVPIPVG
ncbi:FAD/NAD(P)-binding protein [Frankia sp. AiPs1]|uniref:FAD/NAD(P)-binding protein n=1 Tax=Frankia sp. AiPs1 TaxID=573493 RepID=UPI002044986E|nr:FAD/NAD(P)-binding protein [Frankia sp. AiPs1]MCM3920529.1 FAD/NAD(P)-binding protein [Frankia sp. AiPs1]